MSNSYNPMDYSLPGSSVREIFQARILEWVAIFFSRDISDPAIESKSSALEGSLPHCRWMFLLTEPPGRPICASVSLIKLMQKINTAACLLLPSSHPSLRGFSCTPKVRLGAPRAPTAPLPPPLLPCGSPLAGLPRGGPSQSELLIHPWCPLQGWKERTLKSKA